MDLLDTVKNLSVSRRRSLRDDDFFIDRLHHRYTVAALVLFCAVLTTNQYAGDPINCWVPAQFTGSFEAYTNRLCWLQNTYYVEDNSDIPDSMDARRGAMLKYYQWIHLIILFQSMLFIIPRVIWRSMNDKCGIEIVNYVDAAIKYETVDKFAEREKLMEFLTGHINTFIKARENYELGRDKLTYQVKRALGMILFWTGKRYGNYLIILYIFCKFLYLLNVFGQLFLMTLLLGINNYHLLGFEILSRMAKGQDMISNHYFPKVTHCDFKIRELGSDHLYTVGILNLSELNLTIYTLSKGSMCIVHKHIHRENLRSLVVLVRHTHNSHSSRSAHIHSQELLCLTALQLHQETRSHIYSVEDQPAEWWHDDDDKCANIERIRHRISQT